MVASVDFLASPAEPANTTTATFTSQPLGAADASRIIFVAVAGRSGSAILVNGVTLGGVAMTQIIKHNDGASGAFGCAGLYMLAVPTGTTATIAVTFSAGSSRSHIAIWRGVDLHSTPVVDSDLSSSPTGGTGARSVTLDSVVGGFVIGAGVEANASLTSTMTGVVEDYDFLYETTGHAFGGHDATTGTSTTVTSTPSASSSVPILLGVTLAPSAPAGVTGTAASTLAGIGQSAAGSFYAAGFTGPAASVLGALGQAAAGDVDAPSTKSWQAVHSDTFARADGAFGSMDDGTAWEGTGTQPVVVGNQAAVTANTAYVRGLTQTNPDQGIRFRFKTMPTGASAFINLRRNSFASTTPRYAIAFVAAGTYTVTRSGTTLTTQGGSGAAVAIDDLVEFRVRDVSGGVRIELLVNGVLAYTRLDTASDATAPGVAAISAAAGQTAFAFDNVDFLAYQETPGIATSSLTPISQAATGTRTVPAPPPLIASVVATRNTEPVYLVVTGSSTPNGSNATTPAKQFWNILSQNIRDAYPQSNAFTPNFEDYAAMVAYGTLGNGLHFLNEAVGGKRSNNWLDATVTARIIALAPKMIAVMVGSNDWADDVDPATYKANILAKLAELRAGIPGVRFLLLNSHQRGDSAVSGAIYAWTDYGAKLAEIATEWPSDVDYVDPNPTFVALGVPTPDAGNYLDSDNVHLRDNGHAVLAQFVTEQLDVDVVTGAATSTLAAITQSAAGTRTIPATTGAGTSVLGSLSQTAAGTRTVPTFSGTGTSTLAGVGQTATGSFFAAGTVGPASSTLTPLSQTAAGTRTVPAFTGTSGSTLGSIGQAAAGSYLPAGVNGTGASALAPLSQTAAGTRTVPAFTGVATSTLTKLSQLATGTLGAAAPERIRGAVVYTERPVIRTDTNLPTTH